MIGTITSLLNLGETIKQIHNEINNSMDSIQEMYGADTK
jgi:uncharacterized protein with HEPN domain